ncbi:MAG: hypothetical protein AMS18_12520 [Gemmatimonas sp. SG8_17]|nr:MAG: hypothetical protein AMS18_12520 [Gemmatimonas sp. SG8_17]
MYLLTLMTYCAGTSCADLGQMLMIGVVLALTLVVLNLPRVWVWFVDSWNSNRIGRPPGD